MIPDPPSEEGAEKLRVALLTPGVMEFIVGAPEVVNGVPLTLIEAMLFPTAFTARTETGYVKPLVRAVVPLLKVVISTVLSVIDPTSRVAQLTPSKEN